MISLRDFLRFSRPFNNDRNKVMNQIPELLEIHNAAQSRLDELNDELNELIDEQVKIREVLSEIMGELEAA